MNGYVNRIYRAYARHRLAMLPDESIDAVTCDPMYGTSKNLE